MQHFYGVYKSEALKELEEFKKKYDSKIKQQRQAIEKVHIQQTNSPYKLCTSAYVVYNTEKPCGKI